MMRKWLLTGIFFLLPLMGWAQKGLHIRKLFGGPYATRKDVSEVHMAGASLENTGLVLYRSILLENPTENDVKTIEEAVRADLENKKEIIEWNTHYEGKKLSVVHIFLTPLKNGNRRSIHYSYQKGKVALVYAEGKESVNIVFKPTK